MYLRRLAPGPWRAGLVRGPNCHARHSRICPYVWPSGPAARWYQWTRTRRGLFGCGLEAKAAALADAARAAPPGARAYHPVYGPANVEGFIAMAMATVGLAGRGPSNVEIFCWQPAKPYVVVQLARCLSRPRTLSPGGHSGPLLPKRVEQRAVIREKS